MPGLASRIVRDIPLPYPLWLDAASGWPCPAAASFYPWQASPCTNAQGLPSGRYLLEFEPRKTHKYVAHQSKYLVGASGVPELQFPRPTADYGDKNPGGYAIGLQPLHRGEKSHAPLQD